MIKKIFLWAPRILGLIFIVFLSLFALDVFTDYSGWEIILPLIIHLLPTLFLLFILIVSFILPLFGSISFLVIALLYVIFMKQLFLIIFLPLIVISLLFFVSWLLKKRG